MEITQALRSVGKRGMNGKENATTNSVDILSGMQIVWRKVIE